jgi:5'-3' exonuclease
VQSEKRTVQECRPNLAAPRPYADRIPGAVGIGPKGAASLLRKYGSLDNALAAGQFVAQAEKLRLYRSIATMDRSAPAPSLRNQQPTWIEAAVLARRWELNKLAERLEALAAAQR